MLTPSTHISKSVVSGRLTDVKPIKSYELTFDNGTSMELSIGDFIEVSAYHDGHLCNLIMKLTECTSMYLKGVSCEWSKDKRTIYVGREHYTLYLYDIVKITKYEGKRKKPHNTKEVNAVAILGISAEVVKTINVRLRIYDDQKVGIAGCTYIDMAVGRSYRVTYCEHDRDHTIFEIEGRLKQILYDDNAVVNNQYGFIREEHVGPGNIIYDAKHFASLDKTSDIGDQIAFVFDTSLDFEQQTDMIKLRDIRNVVDITDGDVEPEKPEFFPEIPLHHPPFPPHGNDHHPHHHYPWGDENESNNEDNNDKNEADGFENEDPEFEPYPDEPNESIPNGPVNNEDEQTEFTEENDEEFEEEESSTEPDSEEIEP